MKTIKAKINFTLGSEYYVEGEEITDKLSYDQIVKLNEKGFIEPLDNKDLVQIKKELTKPKKDKKSKYNEEEL